ncbi:DUF952 domain-containing protein [Streptomyces sp. NPDC085946]|uniref:DUF952 domain-containing protein n=1 Tax=Streptomyces sp. NPDC085946 TaxID=3365744 RepID=UPI0037D75DC8
MATSLYGSCEALDELVVLVVNPSRLDAAVKYEAPEPGAEKFPHVYGPLPVDSVVRVEPWR